MKKLIIPILLFLLFVAEADAQTENNDADVYVPITKFDPLRDAAKDVENAIIEATQTDKRIILDVGGEWCIWCKYLDEFFETNIDVKKILDENFIVVKVNYSQENKNEEVLSQYPDIPGYPHFFVLESDGTFLHSQGTAELEEGKGHSKEKMMKFLEKWKKK